MIHQTPRQIDLARSNDRTLEQIVDRYRRLHETAHFEVDYARSIMQRKCYKLRRSEEKQRRDIRRIDVKMQNLSAIEDRLRELETMLRSRSHFSQGIALVNTALARKANMEEEHE